MTTTFLDLPVDVLPLILQYLLKPDYLATACLVNKSFRAFSTPQLYKRAAIYSWHRHGKTKVIQLFTTLSQYPQLAKHVHRLEIRDFPKSFTTDGGSLLSLVTAGLRNCTQLQACTWTRDGSLTSDILKELINCQKLHTLEINGHSTGNYDPKLLLQFTSLRKIALIMPSVDVVDRLPTWIARTGPSLTSLTLIGKSSIIINDGVLMALAPHLTCLEHLHLTGCPRITNHGVWTIISSTQSGKGIQSLGLEGVSPKFNVAELTHKCASSQRLASLNSVTLTVDQATSLSSWTAQAVDLLSHSPLRIFQIYSTGAVFEASATDLFWDAIVSIHGSRLTRFSVQRMLISIDAIENVCRRCPFLEELFIVVEQNSVDLLPPCLAHAKNLRALHINYPLEAHSEDNIPVMLPEVATALVTRCSTTLAQFGCNAKVWKVVRTVHIGSHGKITTSAGLAPYEHPDIPEPFLVVRT